MDSANVICLSFAPAKVNSAQATCSNVTLKNAIMAKLIATKARVVHTTINVKFFGARLALHLTSAMIRTRTEVDMETAATIDLNKNTFHANMTMRCVGCFNVVT